MTVRGTNGNQGQRVMDLYGSETTHNGYNSSKYALNFKFPITTHQINAC